MACLRERAPVLIIDDSRSCSVVLEKRVGLNLGQQDVFVNVAGGIRIDEPAVDAAIAVSTTSSLRDVPVDTSSVAVGEIGLGGEIRT